MMEAVKFVEGYSQMCSYPDRCNECPLRYEPCEMTDVTPDDAKAIVAIVEKWVEEHPEEKA